MTGQYGLPYERPARHTREYLTALRPLLRGEHVLPALTAAARTAGRARPAVVAGVCVAVTADPDGARELQVVAVGPEADRKRTLELAAALAR